MWTPTWAVQLYIHVLIKLVVTVSLGCTYRHSLNVMQTLAFTEKLPKSLEASRYFEMVLKGC